MEQRKGSNLSGWKGRRNHPIGQRMLAGLLCVCLMVVSLPIEYGGGKALAAQKMEIVAFEELPQDVKVRQVEMGTPLERLGLPEALKVTCRKMEEAGSISPSEAAAGVSQPEQAVIEEVAWESQPEYSSETEGIYVFTPILPEHYFPAEGLELPKINVAVRGGGMSRGMEREEGEEQNFAGKKAKDEKESLDKLEEVQGEWQELYAAKAAPGCGVISEDATWEGDGTLENGELVVEPGVTLTVKGALTVIGNVTIRGGGTIKRGHGNAKFRVNENSNLTIKDITMEGASLSSPFSMIEVNGGEVALDNGCHFQNFVKTAGMGAALSILGGKAVFNDVIIEHCSAPNYGGAVCVSSSVVTINGGVYQYNKTTSSENQFGGGFIYNDSSKVFIYGGQFIGNSSAGKGGCIYHISFGDTETHLYGGYFEGNVSTYPNCAGSGAIFYSAYSPNNTGSFMEISGNVKFCGNGVDGSGVDGFYLDLNTGQAIARKIEISNTLSYPVTLYLKASEGYVIAKGTNTYTLLHERDMKKINFVDAGGSGKKWYAVLDKEKNQVYLSTTDPQYGYYVYYIGNGAQGTVVDDGRYQIGDTAQVKPADPLQWEGHTFLEWNTEPDGSGKGYQPGEDLNIEGDTDLYAIFEEREKRTFTANFYSGDGCGKETKSIISDKSEPSGKVEAPEPKELEGFTFIGWEEENPFGYTGELKPGQEATLTKEETDFYAVYQKDVTLSYVAEGAGQVPESGTKPYFANVHQEIGYQEPEFTMAKGPEKKGYIFATWNTEPDGGGIDYTEGGAARFTQDTTVYAQYSKKKVLVASFYSGSGCEKETTTVELDRNEGTGKVEAPEPKELEGFTFIGWEEENPFGYTGELKPGQEATLTKEETDFYAVYQKDVTLSYVAEGAGKVPESETKPYFANVHQEIGYQEPEFTIAQGPQREGFTFVGWDTEPDGNGDAYAEGSVEKFTEDTALYAQYSQKKVFAADFYSGSAGSKERLFELVEESILSVEITAPGLKEMEGWEPVGWDADPDSYAGDVSPGTALALTEPLQEYYGVYKKGVMLSYDLNGAQGIIGPDIQHSRANVHGEVTYQIPEFTIASTPSRPGYIFQGWNTLPDGGGEDVPVESIQSYGEDTVLYAIWQEDERAVSYQVEHYKQDLEGDGYTKEGSDTEGLTGIKGKDVEASPKEYAGFHFNNAHPSNALSGKLEEDGKLVLQVYYDRDVYTVDFDLNGGYGTKPDTQKVRYGGLVKAVEEPKKAGYNFKGWRLEDNGLDGGLWDFASPVEANTDSLETTLYAKWADELAPQMGDASFCTERKDFLNWLIKKENLVITVPVLEEGSGMKRAEYTLVPEQGEEKGGEAQVTEQHGLSSQSMAFGSGAFILRALQREAESGRYEAEFTIDRDFKGKVLLTCMDNAGNISATKTLTAMGGGVVVEDNAPTITFSNTKDRMADETVDIDVLVEDSKNGEVSGGIAEVGCQIDQEEVVKLPEEDFQGGMVESYRFTLNLSGEGKHTVKVQAEDNAGNGNTQQISLTIQGKEEMDGQNLAEKEEHDMEGAILETGDFGDPGNPSQPGKPIGGEPKTGGGAQVKIYATAAMVAGFGYLLLYFEGEHGITEEKKEEIVYRLIAWAKGGGIVRRYAGLAVIFLFLAYYHSIGKNVDVEWKEVYAKRNIYKGGNQP